MPTVHRAELLAPGSVLPEKCSINEKSGWCQGCRQVKASHGLWLRKESCQESSLRALIPHCQEARFWIKEVTKSWLKITPGLACAGGVGWLFLNAEVFQRVRREMVSALAITSFWGWQSSEIVVINVLLARCYSSYVNISASTLSGLFNLEKWKWNLEIIFSKKPHWEGSLLLGYLRCMKRRVRFSP